MTIAAPRDSDSTIVVSDVVNYLEQVVQLHYQNTLVKSGLIVGDMCNIVTGILICLDITEIILDEAIEQGCNLIITNQPLLLQPVDKITPESYAGKCVIKAIRHGLSIYIFNTNLDHLGSGASHRIANLMELQNIQPIIPKKEIVYKLTTFVPSHVEKHLIETLYRVGAVLAAHNLAGHVSSIPTKVSYATEPSCSSNFVGSKFEISQESQLTFIIPMHFREKIIQTLLHAHPYEKVTYYVEQIEVTVENMGSGVIGILPIELPAKYFLKYVKTKLTLSYLQHTNYLDQPIKKVAIYAGNGGFLLETVLNKNINTFITTGLQYEQFLAANGKTLMVDIGHYATRLGVKKLILALLSKEFNNIVVLRCKTLTNPIHILTTN
ncbi:Nif3-like dinuclear metal center hexameric protein [Candidatus Cardinium hertigii]|uniref:GTP cyclohydrolase 1 type 2 homolog n=1 Tax=Candidatus Cardinium hertigii TaxID=247481 RepID=A0A3N2QBQ8_9BACT|nr:Nif3-like dinuclear metal center hexameric protein [Candidatus Cardinium hertigii]ROT47220.1 hypothetical protein EDM02_03625 [Candidatus Cardinium hertigii]